MARCQPPQGPECKCEIREGLRSARLGQKSSLFYLLISHSINSREVRPYASICARAHTHMHMCTHMHIYTYVHACTYTYVCTCIFVHTCSHMHTHIQKHTRAYIYLHASIHADTHACTHICLGTHIYIHIHTHTHTLAQTVCTLIILSQSAAQTNWLYPKVYWVKINPLLPKNNS